MHHKKQLPMIKYYKVADDDSFYYYRYENQKCNFYFFKHKSEIRISILFPPMEWHRSGLIECDEAEFINEWNKINLILKELKK